MKSYVVDTHALVWYLTSDSRLSAVARSALESPDSRLLISTLVLFEIKHLSAKSRLRLTFEEIVADLLADARCEICPIELSTVFAASTELDIHDAVIVGVALARTDVEGVITRDVAIANSGLVKIIW